MKIFVRITVNVYSTVIHNGQTIGKKQNVRHWMKGLMKCGIDVQWNIISHKERNKVLIYSITWMNLEDITLREARSLKSTFHMITFI